MSLEDEKIGVIRKYLRDALPGYTVEDGSRTHVGRTLLVFKGAEIQSTVQITTALLDADRPSSHELGIALKNGKVVAKVLSSPVGYLTHSTLAIPEQEEKRKEGKRACGVQMGTYAHCYCFSRDTRPHEVSHLNGR